jgi:hypothetical protein
MPAKTLANAQAVVHSGRGAVACRRARGVATRELIETLARLGSKRMMTGCPEPNPLNLEDKEWM